MLPQKPVTNAKRLKPKIPAKIWRDRKGVPVPKTAAATRGAR